MPKTFHKTLRFRLTLWNTVVVLIASLLALLAVREAMRLTIEKEARQLLREESIELELAISELHPDTSRIFEEFDRKVLGHSQHKWFAALLEEGQFVWKSSNFPDQWEQPGVSDASKQFAFRQTHDWLLVIHPVETSVGKRFQIVLGEPIQFIRNDVWKLTKTMLLIGLGLLIVAPIGGFFLARHATKPVRDIIETTRSLEPSRLNSRLPIRGTGDELDQISTEINSFVEQISKYINSQREFVANAAHELRSPITAIQTSVEVTLDKQRTLAEYEEELVTVSEQCQQLRHLVNQLLELAETDAAEIVPEFVPINLSQLIEQSVNVFSGIAEEKQISVVQEIQSAVTVVGSPAKIRQVINNLLDNALKFSPPNGNVIVGLRESQSDIEFRVCDSGSGIPEEYREKIFERFFQVDQSRQRRDRNGNGLGLSICKAIVEQHGGRIFAENTDTGFSITVLFGRSGTPL